MFARLLSQLISQRTHVPIQNVGEFVSQVFNENIV